MAKIITLAHQKGGVGKSTLTLNLAYSFKDHLHTAIVDLDVQGTISQLKPLIKDVDVISGIRVLEDLQKLPYEVIFVDTPPYLSSDLPELFKISNLVIIPTKPGIADLMAIRATITMLNDVSGNPSLKKAIVFNMVKMSSSITSEIKQLVEEYHVPVFKRMITDRVSFARSLATNNGIYATEDSKAKEELEELTEEIVALLNN
jgi:chromosome partitioning protein